MINQLPPLSLYVHLPWCVRKCPYCDFNSHKAGDAPPRDRYLQALQADLKIEGERAAGRKISTVFIGGGTPSLFSGDEIAAIIECIDSRLSLDPDAEISMEANPGAVERGNLAAYRAAGVNRLSLGAQSFDATTLQRLGRIHGPPEIEAAYASARKAGFDNINIDIMFGLPGQNTVMGLSDVEKAIALQPEHISYYQLTLEPNTVFHRFPPEDMPDEEVCWEMQQAGHDALQAAAYRQYEVSAFARSGRECRHNLNYWEFGDYLATGAGAHGKFTDDRGAIWRYQKPAHPLTYIEQGERGAFESGLRQISPADATFEFMLNILRLRRGFTEDDFCARTGQCFSVVVNDARRAQTDGLLQPDEQGQWRPTELGMRFLNDLQARFLPPEASAKGGIAQDLSSSRAPFS